MSPWHPSCSTNEPCSKKGKNNLRKVLIVDDEEVFLQSLSEGLSHCSNNLCVITARNGAEALKILGSTDVHLVVTDLRMPAMDGFEFLEEMKRSHPDIPVMVMSAFFNQEVEQRLSALGVDHFLEKPLDFEDLVKKLRDEPPAGQRGFANSIPLL